MPHYKFISKHGCLSNQFDQSEGETGKGDYKANNKLRSKETREQTAINCLNNTALTRTKTKPSNSNSTMDVRTIDQIAATDSSVETTELVQRWKDFVKPGIYRLTGGKWKKYLEPKLFLAKRKKSNRRKITTNNAGPGTRRLTTKNRCTTQRRLSTANEKVRTMDRRPLLGSRSTNTGPTTTTKPSQTTSHNKYRLAVQSVPMEEGEIDSETDQDPSILEVPAWNWAKYVGVKCIQYVKMGHAPKVAAQEKNNWDLEQAVRGTEKNFSTDLQLLMTETINDPTLLKTLVCLERQQHELITDEYQTHKRKLSSRFGLVFIEDKIIVPKNLRATVISLLHKGTQ